MQGVGRDGNEAVVVTETVDLLEVNVYADRKEMGEAAAGRTAALMRALLRTRQRIRMIFAAAPSQNEFLESLSEADGIDWARVSAFHMDEYIGLPAEAPQAFGRFLSEKIFGRVNPGEVFLIDGRNDPAAECARYSRLLAAAPIDVVCLGIGENGHLAFNDPPVADFHDPYLVKVVELDETCRRQQVNDGSFESLKDVPRQAITLTIPALLSARHMVCIVPGPTKREAVRRTLRGEVGEACPATALRRHQSCVLFLDQQAYGLAQVCSQEGSG